MQSVRTLAGIDVSARKLTVAKTSGGRGDEKEFDNEAGDHRSLIQWLGRGARVCLEATGVYHLQLCLALRAAGAELMVVNPRVAKDYAKSLGRRSKTDRVDAAVLPFSPGGHVLRAGLVFDRLNDRSRMSLTILFALALGAISSVTDAVVAPPAVAKIVRACTAPAEQRVTPIRTSAAPRVRNERASLCFAPWPQHRADAPLAGAATPRAPGWNC